MLSARRVTPAWALACLLPLVAWHPQDGPDADLRYRVHDTGVTVTVVLNLAFVDASLDIPRERAEHLDPAEFEIYRDEVAEVLAERCPLRFDDVVARGEVTAFDVEEPDPLMLPLFPETGARGLTRLRWVVEHRFDAMPERIDLAWGLYPPEPSWASSGGDDTLTIQARLAVPGDELLLTFSEDEPGYTWHSASATTPDFDAVPAVPAPEPVGLHSVPLLAGVAWLLWFLRGRGRRRHTSWSLPLVAAVAWLGWDVGVVPIAGGGAPLPDTAGARQVFESLHANIYEAFDYTSEGDIYDALAVSVDGDLLESLYEQIYRGLVMAEEGGAVSRVKAVRYDGVEVTSIHRVDPDGAPAFTVEADWQVDGVVHHWGHSHERTNAYTARYDVVARPAGWRLAASEILSQRRLSGAPAPAEPDGAPPPFVLPEGQDL